MTWQLMQDEISAWATHNFGDNPAWQLQLGLIEEIGEYFAVDSMLASEVIPQRIDALGDQGVYALNLCERVGLKFADVSGDVLNIPQDLTDRELMGAMAVCCHALLKNAQGIRGMTWEKRRDRIRVGVGLWYRWAQHQANHWSLPPLFTVVEQTWNQVKLRDWVKNRENADKVASEKQLGEPKTTDYCRQCGESPDSGSHLPHGHLYEDPRKP